MAENEKNADYVLSRDWIDCTRLNMQHSLWSQMFGYLLHPKIDTSKPNLKVADIGTGTAKWLIDLSHKLGPDAQLEGFDCDLSQAPPKAWLPANVTLRHWDIFTEVPEDLIGKYDIVHVKLLVFVLKGDPKPLLQKLVRILKPGGWIQWAEPDVPSMKITKSDPSNKVDALERLFHLTGAQDPRLVPAWPSQLGDIFSQFSLDEVQVHRVDAEPHLEYAMHQCNLLIYEMIANKVAANDVAKEIGRLVPQAAAETTQGAMFAFQRVTVVGQKSNT